MNLVIFVEKPVAALSLLAVSEIKVSFSAAALRLSYLKWQFFSHDFMDPIAVAKNTETCFETMYMPLISHFCKNILFVFTEKKALV